LAGRLPPIAGRRGRTSMTGNDECENRQTTRLRDRGFRDLNHAIETLLSVLIAIAAASR
jgi:hypothetical protein